MKTLPSETLAHIFLVGTQTEPARPVSIREASTFAFLVSHVSHRWREVALSTPRLWRTIFLSGPFLPIVHSSSSPELLFTPNISSNTYPAPWRRRLEHMQTYLRRSWSVPLELYLDLRDSSWSFDKTELSHSFHSSYMSHLLDLLLPHLSRWEDVEILSDTWNPLYVFMKRLQTFTAHRKPSEHSTQADSLRRLALRRCNAYFVLEGRRFLPEDRRESLSLFPTSPPLLRDIILTGVHVSWSDFPFQNLSSLTLNYHAQHVLPSLPEFVNMLKRSPNIERLAIIGWGVRSFDEQPYSPAYEKSIDLPRLRQLTLGWVNVRHTLQLCSLFSWRTPELHTLELEDVSNSLEFSSWQDSSAILNYLSSNVLGVSSSFVGESPRGIRYLRLNSISASKQSYWQFMTGLQSLAVLTLHNVEDSLVLLLSSSWVDHGRETFLCPYLQRVTIGPGGAVNRRALEQLASARGDHELKSGRLTGGKPEVHSRRENHALIIEVESLCESDSETDDHPDAGSREGQLADNSSPFFDKPLGDEALFDCSGDENESQDSSYIAPSPGSFGVSNGSVRDSYVAFCAESDDTNHALVSSDTHSASLPSNGALIRSARRHSRGLTIRDATEEKSCPRFCSHIVDKLM